MPQLSPYTPAWWVFASKLPVVKRTPQLLIRAQASNPLHSVSKVHEDWLGRHGVNQLEQKIELCKQGFELVWNHFAKKRPKHTWRKSWDEPQGKALNIGPKFPVRIHLFDLRNEDIGAMLNEDPITEEVLVRVHTPNGERVRVEPVVALPGVIRRGSRLEIERWFLACVVHELVHVFNAWHLPSMNVDGPYNERKEWKWFDEGLAIATEAELLGYDHDWLMYMVDWLARPERSLDSLHGHYQAGMFVFYLDRNTRHPDRNVPSVAHEAWRRARIGGTNYPGTLPFRVLEEILREANLTLASDDPKIDDVFASGYCMDSYFIWDPVSGGYFPALHSLHGERRVSASLRVGPGQQISAPPKLEFELPHLACRYFRFYPNGGPMTVLIETTCASSASLKAELALVQIGSRSRLRTYRVDKAVISGGQKSLLLEPVVGLDASMHDHLVLTVTNCSIPGLDPGADQAPVKFKLHVRVS